MMQILQWISQRFSAGQIDRVAMEVAGRSRHAVTLRVAHHVNGMTINELRGFVRARSAVAVQSAAKSRLAELAGHRLDFQQIVHEATERVVHLVVRDLAVDQAATATQQLRAA